ncbi:MAG: NADH-quinone oxidoreductase subunit NuoH [Deltaproteobacteria bacterium]|nr:NADH-quinone oxidoreductase subunit NuoH [Deltaproteobacteria bacterium]MBW2010245.1 NADH-quinone oxidoreductase subunit NuoH [Deltaproteobacteria bacterium]MBW2100001.1 NADH-quinone oxidoreductase subunit NuoH [Deltaproteobacteria bacterium]
MEITSFLPPDIIRMIVSAVVIISFVFLNAMVMTYAERKLAGHFQRRPGPMEVGSHGLLQVIVDGLKLIGKQLILPKDVDRPLFRLAPLLAFIPVVLPFIVIPFSEKLQVADLNIGLIFILAISSLNGMAVLIAGWSSNNKYSLFGALRSVAQNIAYEIPILLVVLTVALMANTFSLKGLVEAQSGMWFILLQPVAFIIYFIAGLAETNRAPFDLSEAESELTAGFHTEYSGMGFSLFFLGEYANMFVVCSIATILFLGGWHGIPLPFLEYTGVFWFLLKVYALLFVMIWCRWTYPRVRFDQLMNLAWKYLIPFSLVNFIITAIVLVIVKL